MNKFCFFFQINAIIFIIVISRMLRTQEMMQKTVQERIRLEDFLTFIKILHLLGYFTIIVAQDRFYINLYLCIILVT